MRREAVFRLLGAMEVVEPDRSVLARAGQPMPTALRTLDALHVATALLWRERTGTEPLPATHDVEMGVAARACGPRVIGL